jgi:hypothetical protein
MTFEEAKQLRSKLETQVASTSEALQEFPKFANGLTPDRVRLGYDYRDAKCAYDLAFRQLRAFNFWFVRTFRKELLAERRARKTKGGELRPC